jgi:isopentenyl diphosphate isomerase/L-lactate dehydrogenase-like FMN-dependent dehydrogenase
LNDVSNQVKSAQRQLSVATRRRTIPSGVYSQPVEELFYGLDERRKSEEAEASAMYDVFISHASEDKMDFVDPLVEKFQNAGIRVWYDTLEMQWGKSLREQIDNGIKRSKFAILVLSKNFFAKKWPQRELDGILAKESISGSAPLPIWHNITQEELYDFSPTLSGVFAYSTDKHSIDDICKSFELILEKEKA